MMKNSTPLSSRSVAAHLRAGGHEQFNWRTYSGSGFDVRRARDKIAIEVRYFTPGGLSAEQGVLLRSRHLAAYKATLQERGFILENTSGGPSVPYLLVTGRKGE